MTALAVAEFDAEGAFARARLRAVTEERRIVGEWLPYASDLLGEGEGTRGVRLLTIIAGVAGAAALFALTAWSAILAYPFNTGGRASWSWPAFIPAPVEFGAFVAAVGGAVALFRNARLTRLHHSAFDIEEVARASQDRFVLALACDVGEDANRALALLVAAGATHSRLIDR